MLYREIIAVCSQIHTKHAILESLTAMYFVLHTLTKLQNILYFSLFNQIFSADFPVILRQFVWSSLLNQFCLFLSPPIPTLSKTPNRSPIRQLCASPFAVLSSSISFADVTPFPANFGYFRYRTYCVRLVGCTARGVVLHATASLRTTGTLSF